jgi:riboflavin kinase/FMN adenylyltransferase
MGLTITRDDRGVVTCTVDDAPTRNALGTAVLRDINEAMAALAADPSVRVVVFTGAGTVFSAGSDRSELGDPALIELATKLLSLILTRIEESPVPVICRVNGAAIGAGLAIAAAADIAVAVSDATFVLPEVRFGLVPGPAAAACLARMGQTAGLDLMLTGRRFGADEAGRLHLVASVVGRDALDDAVDALITYLLQADRAALGATRRLVRQLTGPGLADSLQAARAAAQTAAGEQGGSTVAAPGGGIARQQASARPRPALPAAGVPADLRGELPDTVRYVVTFGTFGGMHRGHAEVIRRTVAYARRIGLPSILLMADPHPGEPAQPGACLAELTTLACRAELATHLGVDVVRVLPSDLGAALLDPAEFARLVLAERLHAAAVVVGENFRLGQRTAGPVMDLSELGARYGFTVLRVPLVRDGHTIISDAYLRSCIEAGDVALAGSALGRQYRIDGIVEHGDHRGRTLGFPTANLNFDRFAAVPADGVYAGRGVFLDHWWRADESGPLGAAAISVGTNPTFGGRQRRVEAHILDFEGDLYGRRVGIEFSQRLRGMIRFDDSAALVAQMKRDVEQAREILLA